MSQKEFEHLQSFVKFISLKEPQTPLVFAFSTHLKKNWIKNYCILKASGLAAIYINKEKAATIFKVTSVIDDPDEEMINKEETQCFDIFIFKERHTE